MLDHETLPLSDIRQNQLDPSDGAFHDWYRFVLSFPPHLIRQHFSLFELKAKSVILDPFCGTGTTLVEAKKFGAVGYGQEAHPMAHFASSTKTTWDVPLEKIEPAAQRVGERYNALLKGPRLKFNQEENAVILDECIDSAPLHHVLCLRDAIAGVVDKKVRDLFNLLLATTAVHDASNLSFGPEVGVSKGRKDTDVDVWSSWRWRLSAAQVDLAAKAGTNSPETIIHNTDSRSAQQLPNNKFDFVFTSPPYPNEKDYTRTTRLESVLLGYITNKADLRRIKATLLRSNTRNIYKGDADEALITSNAKVMELAKEIERRREDMGKDSGFEKLYAKVTKMYFGGMKRHFSDLKPKLKDGARLCYVVGDQASFLQVHIQTGELLADIAHDEGYEVTGVEMFRTRFSTATKVNLREEVLMLRYRTPGTQVGVDGLRDQSRAPKKRPARAANAKLNRNDQLIAAVFEKGLSMDGRTSSFQLSDLDAAAKEMGLELPRNPSDLLYNYRYRQPLPDAITRHARDGEKWVIRSIGRSSYEFALTSISQFYANPLLSNQKIADRTPALVAEFVVSPQQRLRALIRYNDLIGKFTETECHFVGGHFRTVIKQLGQITTDEMYVGVDTKTGIKYAFPLQARSGDNLSAVQIEQDFKMCAERFKGITCRPIGAQMLGDNVVALLEFVRQEDGIRVLTERHYQLSRSKAVEPKRSR